MEVVVEEMTGGRHKMNISIEVMMTETGNVVVEDKYQGEEMTGGKCTTITGNELS